MLGVKNNISMSQQKIILGGGCFWCLEAVYQNIKGVKNIISGYAGGNIANPTYRQVCQAEGNPPHVEIVEVTFENQEISLEQILDIFGLFMIQLVLTSKVMTLVRNTHQQFFTLQIKNRLSNKA